MVTLERDVLCIGVSIDSQLTDGISYVQSVIYLLRMAKVTQYPSLITMLSP